MKVSCGHVCEGADMTHCLGFPKSLRQRTLQKMCRHKYGSKTQAEKVFYYLNVDSV